MPAPVLLVHCGQPPAPIAEQHGGFGLWFERALGSRVAVDHWNAVEDPPPPLQDLAGIVITGSACSVTEPTAWMETVIETIRDCAESQKPVLGICFGHQLIGCAYGAPTIRCEQGGEHGSIEVTLAPEGHEDPLFRGFPERFWAQATHYDQVDSTLINPINGLRILASTPDTQAQAFAAPGGIRGVQFHPEFDSSIMRTYLQHKNLPVHAEESDVATSLFGNWLEAWVL